MMKYNKEYTIDDLKMEEKVYANAVGWWSNYQEKFDVNYSTILTKLIQEAGRWCERYASDLFVDWISLMEKLADRNFDGETFLFGFRRDGVDHTSYILSRLNDGESKEYYRSVWRLDVEIENEQVTMVFGKVNL